MTHCVCHRCLHFHKVGSFPNSQGPRSPWDTNSHSAFPTFLLDIYIGQWLCHKELPCSYRTGHNPYQTTPLDNLDYSSLHGDLEGTFFGTPRLHGHMTPQERRHTFSHSLSHTSLEHILLCTCYHGNQVYRHRCPFDDDTPGCSVGHSDTPQSSPAQKST